MADLDEIIETEQDALLPVQTKPTVYDKVGSYKKSIICGIIVLLLYISSYFILIPQLVQQKIDGQGTILQHLHINSFQDIDLSLKVPVDQSPISAQVDLGNLNLYLNQTEIGRVKFPVIYSFANSPVVWINSTLDFEPELPIIQYYLGKIIKHGLQGSMIVKAIPSVHIPILFGTWKANLYREYPIIDKEIDLKQFNASYSDVEIKTVKKKGFDQYFVSLSANFVNPFPVYSKLENLVHFGVYYQGNKILNITVDLRLREQQNKKLIKIESVAEYSFELMEMVGKVAENEDVYLTVKDLQIEGIGEYQDLIDGLYYEFLVPKIEIENYKN
ncbi:hypothetical protein HDV04_000005 [Boothiomyces sp. JEL0838]|nr:hypothetical protein HDV04_000005 [Boothiomyces sp. JEL0838]